MKDLGEADHILGIKLLRDHKHKMLNLSQVIYINKILVHFCMQDSKKGFLPFRHGISLTKDQCPKTPVEIENMKAVFSMHQQWVASCMLCFALDICFSKGIVSKYQSTPRREHWTAVKNIIKNLKRTRDYILVYQADSLVPIRHTNSNFQSDKDFKKLISGNMFTL